MVRNIFNYGLPTVMSVAVMILATVLFEETHHWTAFFFYGIGLGFLLSTLMQYARGIMVAVLLAATVTMSCAQVAQDVVIHKAPIDKLMVIYAEVDGFDRETAAMLINDNITMAFNAGMFAEDDRHVGALYINGKEHGFLNRYNSVLCVKPKSDQPAGMYHMDSINLGETIDSFTYVIQNLMIVHDSISRWDGHGRSRFAGIFLAMRKSDPDHVYIVSYQKPRNGHEIAQLALSHGFSHAQWLEGGPEAQLSYRDDDGRIQTIHAPWEAGVYEHYELNASQPVPWYIGVENRSQWKQ